MKTVKLRFNNSLSSLCGNAFGKQIYEEQVLSFFDENEPIEITVPDNIDTVSMSFAQGFVSDIAERYGMSNVSRHLIIKSSNHRVTRKFNEAITMRK